MSRKPITGYRLVDTRQGDTLQRIALRELGDANKWPELAALNNLLPPYIVDELAEMEDTPASRVLLVGMQVKIPAPGAPPAGVLDLSDLFGTDLDLTGGDLHATEAGDLALISGLPCLGQGLDHRLGTHAGELLHHPTFGQRYHELIGGGSNPVTNLLAAKYAEAAIRTDPRVSAVRGLRAHMRADRIGISGDAVAIDGKTLPVGGE